MTASSYGPRNAPQFADGDAPDVAVNPTQVAAYAAKVGNRRVGTTAERTAATGLDVWEGLEWEDTTDGCTYKYIAAAWHLYSRLVTSYTPTLTNCTLGTGGTMIGDYSISGGVVNGWVEIVLGTGAGITGVFYVDLPVAPDTSHNHIGTCFIVQGTARMLGAVEFDTASRVLLVSSAGVIITTGVPNAWASGHIIRIQFSYPVA